MTNEQSDKHIIVGTAGHVDHGKTTLIKALTGTDTDRLKEEKQRGMTIDLGFASFTLPSGRTVGIIDVPGHERFLKNMLAGASGVDLVLLVIAADEGVMPQTIEHLEILQLLETKKGIVALTKCDMADDEWIEVVEDDIRGRLAGTFLEDAPIVRVSGVTSAGLPELTAAIEALCDEVEQRGASGPFRLPVDRVFTLTGFGTVVTGTLLSGTIRLGDSGQILPAGLQTRIRQLQVHGRKVDEAAAGTRVAANLVGVETSDVRRGDVLAQPGFLKPTALLDATVRLLADAPGPLRNRQRVRLHIGSAELLGRMTILDQDEIKPGQEAFVQFRSEDPLVAARADRFVIRSYSPMRVIGGGTVLEPNAVRHRRFDSKVLDALNAKRQGSPRELVEQALLSGAMTMSDIARSAAIPDSAAGSAAEELARDGRVIKLDTGRLMHVVTYSTLAERIETALSQFHGANPLRAGQNKEELRTTAARGLDQKTFNALLSALQAEGRIAVSENLARISTHEITLSPEQQRAVSEVESVYRQAGLGPPSLEEIIAKIPAAREMIDLLISQGKLAKIDEGLYFHAEAIAAAQELIRNEITKNGPLTVSAFRDLTGSSRKYVVPLLEYFDSKRLTRRVGDQRVLVK
ncbi:MAG: selenocysteine-specific translation elongation factor [Armatimonadota bacterium]|nr:selenocysteine-specific translation elongation factor [Armatimonadota bacterium]